MLAAGTRIGSFEVTGSLGAGGMGAVYKAIDTKLQREVAIKALPPEFAADPDRTARFEREAQTLASLQHPHIGGIHELLEHDGARYLVLEYVAGETLAARIARGAVPLDEALPIARHIAEALEAAHDLGIVHRDLKPANVMVQPNGTAKVLDFGLAKGLGNSSSAVPMSPTITSPAMTAAGIILGTAAYMSPEQARGKPVDRRTDVWAFGCVLYEMLTGRMAFAGDTVSDIISGILRAEPDWTPLPADTPDSVRRLLALCLTKDTRERLPHIGLARIELASGRTSTTSAASVNISDRAVAGGTRSSRLAWMVAAVAVLTALTVAGVSMWPKSSAPSLGVVRFELSPPEGTERFGHAAGNRGTNPPAPHYALSPDGKTLAFVALESSVSSLWLRSLDSGVAQRLPGTEDASFPFWSPDGQSIAFFAQAQLKRIARGDPSPVVICPAEAGEGGAWAADGLIYFAPTANGGLWRVMAHGGVPAQVTTPPSAEFHRWPVLVNGDARLLYLAVESNRSMLRLRDLARGSEVDVFETPSRVMASRGHLLFQRNGQLWAQRFDEATGALSGEPTRLLSDIGWSTTNSRAGFHVSGAGVLVHREGFGGVAISRLIWRDRAGRELGSVSEADRYTTPALSPQGDRVAVGVSGAGINSGDIWVIDLARGVRTRLTAGDGRSVAPVWSPDGKEIAFRGAQGGSNDVLMIVGTGGAATPQVAAAGVIGSPTTWVPGRRAIVATATDGAVPFVQQVPLDGGTPTRLLPSAAGSFTFRGAQFSPDGQLIAYESDETGSYEVYVQPWPITADKWRVSTNGGQLARWRPSGGELYYVSNLGELMALSVSGSVGARRFGTPALLFNGVDQNRLAYVPSLDGERFLTLQQTTASTSAQFSPLHVTLNWQQLLPK
jgi:eukaryotic-like serine/threonine-protein kinase